MVAFRCLQPWSQNLCIDQNSDFDNPTCGLLPQPSVSNRSISKQEFFAAAMLREICNLRCEFRLLPTHTNMSKVWFQMLVWRLGLVLSSGGEFYFQSRGPFGVWWRCYNWPTKLQKRTSNAQSCFLYKVRWPPPKQTVRAFRIWKWFCPAMSNGSRADLSHLGPCGTRNQCAAS